MTQQQMSRLLDVPDRTLRDWKKSRQRLYNLLELLEYKEVKDNSIFLKFKIKGKENEFLVVWTTTPWTIPANLAICLHPDFV